MFFQLLLTASTAVIPIQVTVICHLSFYLVSPSLFPSLSFHLGSPPLFPSFHGYSPPTSQSDHLKMQIGTATTLLKIHLWLPITFRTQSEQRLTLTYNIHCEVVLACHASLNSFHSPFNHLNSHWPSYFLNMLSLFLPLALALAISLNDTHFLT